MIKICSYFDLPIREQRIGHVYQISNGRPRQVMGISGKIKPLIPPWDLVKGYKKCAIGRDEFTDRYREHLRENWSAVKTWLDSLTPRTELYLCCWEREGFCHRQLVAKMIRTHRPDLKVRLT